MKTILRILTILLIGTLVAAGIYLIVQNTTLASDMSSAPSFDQLPATTTGDASQLPTRPEGDFDHDSASLSRGLSEVSVSLAKLAGITVIVLLVQFLLARLMRRRAVRPIAG
jgi:hypothetical protein